MPSTYAHYVFGQQVLSGVRSDIAQLIRDEAELYRIGLHGPDILFYYKPLQINPINRIGYELHDKNASDFFSNAGRVITASAHPKASMAYILGFICHYVLDSECHTYIEKKISDSGISHTEIEVEFDRRLMCEAGLDPLRHKLTEHICPRVRNGEIISAFFDGADSTQITRALTSMKKYNNMLIAPHWWQRLFVLSLLRVTGNYKEMHGLLVNRKPNPLCEDSTEILRDKMDSAVPLAVELIEDYFDNGLECPHLNPLFHKTFGVDQRLLAEMRQKDSALYTGKEHEYEISINIH